MTAAKSSAKAAAGKKKANAKSKAATAPLQSELEQEGDDCAEVPKAASKQEGDDRAEVPKAASKNKGLKRPAAVSRRDGQGNLGVVPEDDLKNLTVEKYLYHAEEKWGIRRINHRTKERNELATVRPSPV